MRALTLWQPWAWAISDFTKRIENRIWAPWKATLGHRLAIHAGKRYDREAEAQITSHFKVTIPPRWSIPQSAIVAVCRVVDYVHEDDHPDQGQRTALLDDPWFSGPYGWVLSDVQKLATPVPCRGAQGLWRMTAEEEKKVEQQLEPPLARPAG